MSDLRKTTSRVSNITPGEAGLEAGAFVAPLAEDNEEERKDIEVGEKSQDEKTLASEVETPVPKASDTEFPDGGLRAWLVVLGGFWTVFCGFGIASGIGGFQILYEQDILKQYSSSQIAWITSTQAFITFSSAVFTGPLFDRYGHKPLIALGGFLLTLGFCMLSLCSQYYQIFIVHATLISMGCNFLFICPVAVVAQWFKKRRGMAFGFMSCGSSLGSCIWPIVLANLPPKIGFGWTCRVMALIAAVCSILAFFLLKTRLPPRPPGPYFYLAAFRIPQYCLIVVYFFMLSCGFFCFLTFIGTYGALRGLGDFAPYLLIIANACSSIGRLGSGVLADIIGLYNITILGGILITLMSWIWTSCSTKGSLIALSAIYGIASGNFVALQPPLAVNTADDLRYGATMIGQALLLQSTGQLFWSPLFGAFIGTGTVDQQLKGFSHAVYLAASMMVVALVAIFVARIKTNRTFWVKV